MLSVLPSLSHPFFSSLIIKTVSIFINQSYKKYSILLLKQEYCCADKVLLKKSENDSSQTNSSKCLKKINIIKK